MFDLQFTVYGLKDNARTFFPTSLVERDTELRKLLMLLYLGFETSKLETDIDEKAFNIQQMNLDMVDKWLKTLGWKQNIAIDKRRLLKTLITLWRLGGTDQGIKKAIEDFVGIKIAGIVEAWPEAYKKGQTLSDDQKRNVTVYLSNYPLGEQTLNYVPLAQQIANLLKPVYVKLTVEVVRHINADFPMPINNLAGKTINYITYMPL